MNYRNNLIFGTLLAPVGVIAAVLVSFMDLGMAEDWVSFLVYAPIAIFIAGFIFYPLLSTKKNLKYFSALIVGMLCGTLSHYICWVFMGLSSASNFEEILKTFIIGLVLTPFSLILLGWLTVLYSIIVAILYVKYIKITLP
ncbi:MAG: hypothetical protein LBQ18_04945 [Campylobacteraceae bacterium]|jgi:ethanolamine transporter EutH|nr:hypothetical protein [Campylobacteraceae bacterium]